MEGFRDSEEFHLDLMYDAHLLKIRLDLRLLNLQF
jgi:hypothetical protein